MGTRSTEKIQSILSRPSMRLLMTKDDTIGIVVDSSKGDQSSAFYQVTSSREGKGLRVNIDGRLGILLQQPARPPVMQVFSRTSVDVKSIGVSLPPLPRMILTRLCGLRS